MRYRAALRPDTFITLGILIVTDDQDVHSLRAYNQATTLQTPVLDRLTAEGMTTLFPAKPIDEQVEGTSAGSLIWTSALARSR